MSNNLRVSYKFKWNDAVKIALQRYPDKVMYAIASQTLSKTIPIIPMSTKINGGTLRRVTGSYGVKKSSELGYHLKSNVDYAVFPHLMNDSKTNWSTSGTHSHWFDKTWKEQHESIINSSINQNKI